MRNLTILGLSITILTGCTGAPGPETGNNGANSAVHCTKPEQIGTVPPAIAEASGLAASRRWPGTLWTHNDSGNSPTLFAIDSTGLILNQLEVTGATNRDWEDIALGPCPTGECLYIADTGDNRLRFDESVIYRVPEPEPDDTATATVERFPIRYPNGPRDIEAIFTLPDGGLFLISKGRKHPAELYRYPPPLRPDTPITLQEIQRLSDSGLSLPHMITGASASPNGRWVAVRSYAYLQLYQPTADGTLEPLLPAPGISLDELREPQGEGVALADDGTVLLISEAGPAGVPGNIGRLQCQLAE